MKKNKMMRVASVLLVAVLLTTSVISGTFAKYVTSGEKGDSARVAKFGVVVTGSGSLFGTTYFKADTNTPGGANWDEYNEGKDVTTLTVESLDKVVAPGTKNDEGLTFGITGTPEVDVRITFDLDVKNDVFLKYGRYEDRTTSAKGDYFWNGTVAGYEYHPLVFTLTGKVVTDKKDAIETATGLTVTGNAVSGTLAQIKNVLSAINEAGGIYVDANTNLAAIMGNGGSENITLTWAWAFGDPENNKADTLLGDIAAGVDLEDEGALNWNYSINVDAVMSVTVSQVD